MNGVARLLREFAKLCRKNLLFILLCLTNFVSWYINMGDLLFYSFNIIPEMIATGLNIVMWFIFALKYKGKRSKFIIAYLILSMFSCIIFELVDSLGALFLLVVLFYPQWYAVERSFYFIKCPMVITLALQIILLSVYMYRTKRYYNK